MERRIYRARLKFRFGIRVAKILVRYAAGGELEFGKVTTINNRWNNSSDL